MIEYSPKILASEEKATTTTQPTRITDLAGVGEALNGGRAVVRLGGSGTLDEQTDGDLV